MKSSKMKVHITSVSKAGKKVKSVKHHLKYVSSLFTESGNFLAHLGWKGNPWVIFLSFIFGILIPPLMAFAVIYFFQRNFKVRPRLFGRYLWIYAGVVAFHMIISVFLFSDYPIVFFQTRFFEFFGALLVFYILEFTWLWYDYHYGKKS